MAFFPAQLEQRLSHEERAALHWAAEMEADAAGQAYRDAVADHHEAKGDEAQLFGNSVRIRHRFQVERRIEGQPLVVVEDLGWNIHRLRVGPLRIKSYKLGEFVDDDIHRRFPEPNGGYTVDSDGIHSKQMGLFSLTPESSIDISEAALVNDLIFGHFGNPREGLVKHYLGALGVDDQERRYWAWVERQDQQSGATERESSRPSFAPFDQRPAVEFLVNPKGAQTGNVKELRAKGD